MTAMPPSDLVDVIDRAAGLAPGDPLHAARRFRAKVVEATAGEPRCAAARSRCDGLSSADRLRVAAHVCTIAGATSLAQHYEAQLAADAGRDAPPSPALPAMLRFAAALTTDPRRGDRAAHRARCAAPASTTPRSSRWRSSSRSCRTSCASSPACRRCARAEARTP